MQKGLHLFTNPSQVQQLLLQEQQFHHQQRVLHHLHQQAMLKVWLDLEKMQAYEFSVSSMVEIAAHKQHWYSSFHAGIIPALV
jgi:hypothetical protein